MGTQDFLGKVTPQASREEKRKDDDGYGIERMTQEKDEFLDEDDFHVDKGHSDEAEVEKDLGA
jgi:hypothetical protein